MKAESSLHFAPAEAGDVEGPAVEILGHPSLFQCDFEECGAKGSAEMRPPLTPIETGGGEAAPQRVD
jgi:hypothetical protein